MLGFAEAIIGDMISLVAVAAILAGIIKLFQVASALNEIKDLLVEIKRNTRDYSAPGQSRVDQAPGQRYPGDALFPPTAKQSGEEALQAALAMNPEP